MEEDHTRAESLTGPDEATTSTGGGTSRFSCFRGCSDIIAYLVSLRSTPEELQQRYNSKEIDKFLEKEKHTFRRQVKLLLLGAGESGKSTFLKQMRIIHGVNFDYELLREYQNVIYQNVVRGMQVLLDAREKLDIAWGTDGREQDANEAKLMECKVLESPRFIELAPQIRRLWQDRGIRRAFERRREFQISDSVSYFLDEIERLAKPDYVPTHKDILHCRKATKGVYEFCVKVQNIPFVFVDVGGQRTQRQKWTKCFDSSVTSIIFLVSSSEFDQVLAEDRKTNRLEESKNIFDTIVNNSTFKGISIILFLNKTDLLEQKVRNPETDIRWYYPRFSGNPHSVFDVQNFILQMFIGVHRSASISRIYHHFTTAIDTRNINVVFNSVKDTILQRNLNALMLQ
ncbi:guanine nucleotide-binding protein subunit alpha homolog isoform X1 [Drosophila eugracilis]|uniref:guanine nucleotide-binding protein subunit alpha homolog isoform X1 n=1 Tax=Drosophila eugracilis TaxID=29029 RepID=UPI001BDB0ED3|nr:guanine nucleotide-binding protein subunit alpha homolog isoform X1 [Drosophila eugracilis]XP_041675199.1 guanine nucleotide-binding protein subunit alpha homolog isoform X1 [Drosophila eugracilis]XP_041675200.1 guanine nucleotide-binding protein subunit alpha homolog isoform X1 [Drosophila eugracilis]